MNKAFFAEVAEQAQKAKIRPQGVLLYNKTHGYDVPNTKGLAKFFRWLLQYYKDQEPLRLRENAELLAKEKEIQEQKKIRGLN